MQRLSGERLGEGDEADTSAVVTTPNNGAAAARMQPDGDVVPFEDVPEAPPTVNFVENDLVINTAAGGAGTHNTADSVLLNQSDQFGSPTGTDPGSDAAREQRRRQRRSRTNAERNERSRRHNSSSNMSRSGAAAGGEGGAAAAAGGGGGESDAGSATRSRHHRSRSNPNGEGGGGSSARRDRSATNNGTSSAAAAPSGGRSRSEQNGTQQQRSTTSRRERDSSSDSAERNQRLLADPFLAERHSLALEMRRIRAEYHTRPRCTLTQPPLLISAPILDRPAWTQPLCYMPLYFPCCMRHQFLPHYTKEHDDGMPVPRYFGDAGLATAEMDELDSGNDMFADNAYTVSAQQQAGMTRRRTAGGEQTTAPGRRNNAGAHASGGGVSDTSCGLQFMHTLFRCFCVRCSVAQQTALLFQEERARQRYPYRFCCEGFFGEYGSYYRTLFTMICLDIVTVGLPCGCLYHGMGTACYGWRIRYLVRCRYRVRAITIADLFQAMCVPMQCVDQQGSEMCVHGLRERHSITAPVYMK